jgi:hypothetical protein
MKKSIVFIMAVFSVILLIGGCAPKQKAGTVTLSKEELTKKGEYLVTIMGCNDCHSPKKMGAMGPEVIPELALSGYPSDHKLPAVDPKVMKDWVLFSPDLTAAVGPWGTSFSANLTSDSTGVGNWKEENFRIAFTKGKFMGFESSRSLLPPMPWQNFVNIKDENPTAIFTYLQSTKPVKNIPPAPLPPVGGK